MTTSVDTPAILVIGAGLAGCACALTLAQGGARVMVLERGAPGKEKVCGDAFLPSAGTLLASLGIDLAHLPGQPFDTLALYLNARKIWDSPMTPTPGWIVRRRMVDQALRDQVAAQADIHYLAQALTITPQAGSVETLVQYPSRRVRLYPRLVILAAGSSPLAKKLGIHGFPAMTASLTTYACLPSLPLTPRFEFQSAYAGWYRWIFPGHAGMANIGVCALTPKAMPWLKPTMKALLEELGLSNALIKGGIGPLWSGRGQIWHHAAGILSCGDQAGLADPLSGEGITAALESGLAAARFALLYLNGENNALNEYSHWTRSHFGERYRPSPIRQTLAALSAT